MKKTANLLFGVLLTIIFSTAVFGQTGSGIGSISITTTSGSFPGIKGMPYSGESIRETVQTLLDGNKITRSYKTLEYRDSEGRTRSEQISQDDFPAGFSGQIPTIRIFDPVAGFFYSLNPTTKTAYRASLAPRPTVSRPFTPVSPPAGYSVKREPLGNRVIDGFETTGTRTVSSIAAGTIGNEKSLDTVGEYWTATELRVILLSTSNDPRSGVSTMRLTNIKRDEPDKSLFEIPADYKITDQPSQTPVAPAEKTSDEQKKP